MWSGANTATHATQGTTRPTWCIVLASVFLFGRPRWERATITTVILGTAVGGLMGAHLHAAATFGSAGDVLGLYMVLWQTTVGASLGRGLKARSNQGVEARDGAKDAAPWN